MRENVKKEKAVKEKDIKKVFDTCYGNGRKAGKTEVDPEKVKASVMEKMGLKAAEGFYTDKGEEAVTPVLVVPPKKENSGIGIKFAAWVGAAACLCAVVMGLQLFGESGLLSPQAGGTDLDLSGEDKDLQLPLVDGMMFVYKNGEKFKYDHLATEWPGFSVHLYEKDKRLYYVETMEVHSRGDVIDITDMISTEDYFLYSYENEDNSINPTHYILIGGDVNTGKYGYAEIFKVKNSTNTWGFACGFSYDYVLGKRFCEPVDPDAKWLANGINYLDEKYNIKTDTENNNIGCCRQNVDFSYRENWWYGSVCTEKYPYMPLRFLNGGAVGVILSDPVDEISDRLRYYEAVDYVTPLLCEENGRIFFISNNEYANNKGKEIKEDVTDKLTPDDCYIYSYENSENIVNQTHYIVICGDLSKNEYGWWEVYQIHKAENENDLDKWEWYGKYFGSGEYSDKEWFINAKKVLEEEYGVT